MQNWHVRMVHRKIEKAISAGGGSGERSPDGYNSSMIEKARGGEGAARWPMQVEEAGREEGRGAKGDHGYQRVWGIRGERDGRCRWKG